MKKYLRYMSIGIAMGTADVIPGVSGGTVAFISGIYDKLITSIARIDKHMLQLLYQQQYKKAWIYIQGNFLVSLFLGIILAIIALAHSMSFLITHYPLYVYALFFGLIGASILLIIHQHLIPWHRYYARYMVTGILLGYIFTFHAPEPTTTVPSLAMIGLAGMSASIAMILPGISGSYILLLLGQYAYILETVKTQINHIMSALSNTKRSLLIQYETLVLCIFILGIIIGLVSFSKILQRLLHYYHTQTLSILIGIMIGTLPMIRPWSGDISAISVTLSCLFCLLGIVIIYGIYYITNKKTAIKKTTP